MIRHDYNLDGLTRLAHVVYPWQVSVSFASDDLCNSGNMSKNNWKCTPRCTYLLDTLILVRLEADREPAGDKKAPYIKANSSAGTLSLCFVFPFLSFLHVSVFLAFNW